MDITPNGTTPTTVGNDLIKEASTATFQQDVIDASGTVPVLVDFWAPWCGPCRQLGPAIEKVVTAFAGKVRLVKINVDENQTLAGQMGVQSIPAVFGFVGGRPVDGFMGALPESDIQKFVQKLIDASGGGAEDGQAAQIAEALKAADAAESAQDFASAEQIYGLVLQHAPDHTEALIGLTRVLIANSDFDRAEATLALVDEAGQKQTTFTSAQSDLQLKREAAALGGVADLQTRLEKQPDDHQLRFDLALALNADGEKLAAAETLIDLMRRDRDWNQDGARLKLLAFFEAWGPTDPATIKGRRLLSALLFA